MFVIEFEVTHGEENAGFAERDVTMNILSDGPFLPDGFAIGGKVAHVKRKGVWKLISFLWATPNRRASFDSLAEPVWGNTAHDISYMAIASLRREANRFFGANDFPLKVQIRHEAVWLIDQRD